MERSKERENLRVGALYLGCDGSSMRRIESIEGGTVHWRDRFGLGRCDRDTFQRLYPTPAPAGMVLKRLDQSNEACGQRWEFSVRDEANALTAFAFRNGFIEELHAGQTSPLLSQPGYSRISNEEMRRLMIEASEKLARMLTCMREAPQEYESWLRRDLADFCEKWERD